MQTTDIKQATLEFIKTFCKKEYIGKIEVEKLNPQGFSVTLFPQGIYVPTVFYAEVDDKKFLKYLREEIRNKKYHLQWYGELNKREPDYCPINKSCNCHDK